MGEFTGDRRFDGDVTVGGALKAEDTFGLGVTPQAMQSHIDPPSGGAIQDAEARAAISSILAALEAFGLVSGEEL